MTEELKPCPFCGETKDLSEYDAEDWMADKSIRCDTCGALGPPASTLIQTQKAWNYRVEG